MHKKHLLFPLTIVVLLFSLALGACSAVKTAAPELSSEPVQLKVAVLPILDTLPMYVAQQEGLFEAHGVGVAFIPVSSAPERDQIITAGKADAMINELVSTIFYNQKEVQIQIVRFARTATEDQPVFRILAAADSGIESLVDLKGVEIGISEGTVIEYLTDRLLQAEGFSDDEIATIAVPKIPDRMALLESGELKAAMLPDPLSSLVIQHGATVVIDDTRHPEYGFSVISFRKQVIDDHPQAVAGFLAALEEATAKINADPSQFSDLLAEKKLVPPPVMGSYQMPQFPTAGVPSQAQWDDAVEWVTEKELLNGEAFYTDSVNDSFLP